MSKKLFSVFIISLMSQTLFSQQRKMATSDRKSLTNTSIDSLVTKLMDTAGVTGLSIGIVNNNKADYIKSYGYKNKATNQFNDTSTSFYAASLSKPVFAFIVMQLVDKGIINLDKPLYKYLPKPLPEYNNYKDLLADERWKLITARECLNHTTGFPNWRQFNPNGTEKLEIFFTPGTRYAYSGEGLYLLQLVVETVTNKKLEALAQEQVFQPFAMTKTSFIWQKAFDKDYAVGHDTNEDTLPIRKRNEANAAGSMQTTIADYTRFIACVMQGKGISSKAKQQMLSSQIGIFTKQQFPSLNNDTTNINNGIKLSYGLGWGLFESSNGWAFFKEGHSEDGWQHYAIGFPDKKSAFIIMTNCLNGESIFKELVEKISGATIPWEWEGYKPYQPTVKVSENILAQYVGDYDGRVKARVSLLNGQLKVEASTEGLNKTNLYPASENHFFMKSMPINIEFVKQTDGKIVKMVVNDEGEKYELNRVNDKILTKSPDENAKIEVKLSKDILSAYIGKYELAGNPQKVIVIKLQKDYLVAKLLGQDDVELIFWTDTKFKFKSVMDIRGEFIIQNGKVTKLIVDQNGKYEWKKIL
jgi:CubicO group peptidase (beta-lactamase class C family)